MCPEHEMEKVNMYCEVCRRPVCHLCKLGGSHASHKVTSMSSAYKILKVTTPLSHTHLHHTLTSITHSHTHTITLTHTLCVCVVGHQQQADST